MKNTQKHHTGDQQNPLPSFCPYTEEQQSLKVCFSIVLINNRAATSRVKCRQISERLSQLTTHSVVSKKELRQADIGTLRENPHSNTNITIGEKLLSSTSALCCCAGFLINYWPLLVWLSAQMLQHVWLDGGSLLNFEPNSPFNYVFTLQLCVHPLFVLVHLCSFRISFIDQN